VLVQFIDGCMRVYKSWVYNEPPLEAMEKIIPEAILAGGAFAGFTPAEQMDKFMNNGVPAAFKTRKIKLLTGKPAASSIRSLQPLLIQQRKGSPAFLVSGDSKTVINAMAAGYLRRMTSSGTLSDLPEQNQYSLIMEALESFASYILSGNMTPDEGLQYAYTSQGRRFISMLPERK